MNDLPVHRLCHACGDPAIRVHLEKPLCLECFNELARGRLAHHERHVVDGIPSRMEDDGGPWQQNAVRAMEDG